MLRATILARQSGLCKRKKFSAVKNCLANKGELAGGFSFTLPGILHIDEREKGVWTDACSARKRRSFLSLPRLVRSLLLVVSGISGTHSPPRTLDTERANHSSFFSSYWFPLSLTQSLAPLTHGRTNWVRVRVRACVHRRFLQDQMYVSSRKKKLQGLGRGNTPARVEGRKDDMNISAGHCSRQQQESIFL